MGGAAHRGLAARLRQGHHAGIRRRQSHQTGNPERSHPRNPHPLRGAQARCLDQLLAGHGPGRRRARNWPNCATPAWTELDDDFAFVARCNLGGEAMADADLQRLRSLAQRTWTRTLDDRLGRVLGRKPTPGANTRADAAGQRAAAGGQARAPVRTRRKRS